MVIAAVLLLTACDEGGEVDRLTGACPTPTRPYLHLDNPDCLGRIPPPRLTDLVIAPFGGKVPVDISFRAEASVPYPELAAGLSVLWDIDGERGVDVQADLEETIDFRYTECGNVLVEAVVVDRYGRSSEPNQKLITNRCNQIPVITTFMANRLGAPQNAPIARVGQAIRFTFKAYDPDASDPDLADADGIVRFEFDFEGDGVFDRTVPGAAQFAPIEHAYDKVGVYRPVIRAYDADGDFAEDGPLTVSIFASSALRGRIRVHGEAEAVEPLAWRNLPASAFAGWGSAGVGLWERPDSARRLYLRANHQRGDYDRVTAIEAVRDLRWLDGLGVLTANGANGVTLWRIPDTSPDPLTARRYACGLASAAKPRRALFTARLNSGERLFVLQSDNEPELQVYRLHPDLWGAVNPENPDLCKFGSGAEDRITTWRGGTVGRSVAALTQPVLPQAAAVAGEWLFVAGAENGGSGGGLLTVHLDGASGLPAACDIWPDACVIETDRAATAVAADFGGMMAQPVSARSAVDRWRLHREVTAATNARLWVADTAHPAGSGWSFVAGPPSSEIEVSDASLRTAIAAGGVTLAAEVRPMVAVAWSDGVLAVAPWELTAAPSFGAWTTVAVPRAIDELALTAALVAWRDASTVWTDSGDAWSPEPQSRGVYVAPLTAPARSLQLRAWRQALRRNADYAGPRRIRSDPDLLWVADGPLGLWAVPHAGLAVAAWADGPTATTDESPRALAAGATGLVGDPLPGFAAGLRRGAMEADEVADRAYLAAGDAGVLRVRVDDVSGGAGGEGARARLDWGHPGERPVRDLALLPADADGGAAVAFVENRCGYNQTCAEPESRLATILAAEPGIETGEWRPDSAEADGLYSVRVIRDPAAGARGLLMTGRRQANPAGLRVDLWGLAADGAPIPGSRKTIPDDFGLATLPFTEQRPPIFGNLNPAQGDRSLLLSPLDPGRYDRICIEAFWGGSCAGNIATSANLTGSVYAMASGGNRYGVYSDSLRYSFRTVSGQLLTTRWHPCADLPEAEREACGTNFSIYDTAVADPWWVLSTSYALFVVDVSDPLNPFVVTRQLQCARLKLAEQGANCYDTTWDLVAAWRQGAPVNGLRVVLRADGGRALQVLDVPELFSE